MSSDFYLKFVQSTIANDAKQRNIYSQYQINRRPIQMMLFH